MKTTQLLSEGDRGLISSNISTMPSGGSLMRQNQLGQGTFSKKKSQLNQVSESFISEQDRQEEQFQKTDKPLDLLFKLCSFKFGSNLLACIYMANIMVIPEMNQVQNEISFESKSQFLFSIAQYFLILITVCVPCYLIIKQCERQNSPFYNQVIAQYSPMLGVLFLRLNIVINILSLFNMTLSVIEYTLSSAPCMFVPISNITKTSDNSKFFFIWFCYYITCLIIHYGLYKISYFENFTDIQGRLIIAFFGKWLLFLVIFVIVFFKQECEISYLGQSKILLQDITFKSAAWYYTNVFYCLSFPFIEIYHIKRQTKTNQISQYHSVKQVYKVQLVLRSSFLFMQLVGWGLLYQIHQQKTFNCASQVQIQMIMMVLTIVTVLTVAPICANNYALNVQILNNELLNTTKENHKKRLAEIYFISGLILTILFIAVIVLRMFTNKFWELKTELIDTTKALQTFCFGIGCISIPLWVQAQQSQKVIFKFLFYPAFLIVFGLFTIILLSPLINIYWKLRE